MSLRRLPKRRPILVLRILLPAITHRTRLLSIVRDRSAQLFLPTG